MRPLLPNISPELTESLHKLGRKRSYAEEGEIFAEGDEAAFLPIVLSGSVKMFHFLEPGKEVIIGIFQPGEMFALPPVIDGGRYPAMAAAMEPSQLLLISRKNFLELLNTSNELSLEVIRWMSAMLRDKTATIQNLATSSPDHRVAAVLLKLSEKEEGAGPVKIALRRQDIAKMAGLTTETTIRVIRRLADRGLVEIVHGKVLVRSVDPLREFIES